MYRAPHNEWQSATVPHFIPLYLGNGCQLPFIVEGSALERPIRQEISLSSRPQPVPPPPEVNSDLFSFFFLFRFRRTKDWNNLEGTWYTADCMVEVNSDSIFCPLQETEVMKEQAISDPLLIFSFQARNFIPLELKRLELFRT